MKYKTIKITEEAYEKIKTFCNRHNLKISAWAEGVLVYEVKEKIGK
jgi:hypothetical protein